MLDSMKTITTREFFHAPSLIKSLQPGQSLVVTDKGNPAFTVIRAGKRRRKTRADLDREAAEICPKALPKVNFTAAIKEMKCR
jgi:hypothetical protein